MVNGLECNSLLMGWIPLAMHVIVKLNLGLILGLWIGFVVFAYEFCGMMGPLTPIPNILNIEILSTA